MGEVLVQVSEQETCLQRQRTRNLSRSKKVKQSRNNFRKRSKSLQPVYVGESFVVRLCSTFYFRNRVISQTSSGVVHTQMHQLQPLGNMSLSSGASRMANSPNAGGSSEKSEILSFELLQRCFGAILQKTETEVEYFPLGGCITDYTCTLFGTTLGISVTRAMKFHGEFTSADANHLLWKKLNGVNSSSQNSLEKWTKQILHVWASSARVAAIVGHAYRRLPAQLKSNTVVLITVATNTEIFKN